MARKVSRGFKCVKCGERYRAKDVVTFDTPTGTPPRRFICRDCAEEEGIDFEEAKDKEGE
jgi:hypothetical protein